jgi:hypothetical protein
MPDGGINTACDKRFHTVSRLQTEQQHEFRNSEFGMRMPAFAGLRRGKSDLNQGFRGARPGIPEGVRE